MLLIIGCNSKIAKYLKKYLKKDYYLLADKKKGFDYCINLNHIKEIDLHKNISHAVILSGFTNIEFCDQNPKLAQIINGENTIRLINILNAKGIRVLFPSSTCVFPSKSRNNFFEYSQTNSDNVYGQIKAYVENNIIGNNLNTILRISKIITPEDTLITTWKKDLKNKKEINPFYDLRIAPTSVLTVAKFISEWFLNDFNGIVHLSPSTDITYFELANELCSFLLIDKSFVKANSILNLPKKIIYNPQKAFLNCNSKNSKQLNIHRELETIFKNLI